MIETDPNPAPNSADHGSCAVAVCSPVIPGDWVSLRRWLNSSATKQRLNPCGRVVQVWRSGTASGFMVYVRTGFLQGVSLDAKWVDVI